MVCGLSSYGLNAVKLALSTASIACSTLFEEISLDADIMAV